MMTGLCIHVTSMEDVTGFSERIQTFVTDQGLSGKAAYFSALAMEEMAGNIVIAYPIFQKYFIRGLTIGSVKG